MKKKEFTLSDIKTQDDILDLIDKEMLMRIDGEERDYKNLREGLIYKRNPNLKK